MSAASSRPAAAKARRPRLRVHLPWWALALPVISFVVLLILVASPAEARAASAPQGLVALVKLLARMVRGGV
ncbi:hypothetical protein OHS81_28745 [Streptomyces sp. NBC_00400]|uniref:hypothetical protein n=1 Tax=Streptomyces sp. NBC_00400 TaxID=2975737 RepID=UPI002E1D850C